MMLISCFQYDGWISVMASSRWLDLHLQNFFFSLIFAVLKMMHLEKWSKQYFILVHTEV